MNAQSRLNVNEIVSRYMAKGSDPEVDILVMYIDLALKSIGELRKKAETAKALVDAKNKIALEKGQKKLDEAKAKEKKGKVVSELKGHKPKTTPKKKTVAEKPVVKVVKKEVTDPKVS
jgi:hypothetical protein